jgi:hypothetical protein
VRISSEHFDQRQARLGQSTRRRKGQRLYQMLAIELVDFLICRVIRRMAGPERGWVWRWFRL